MSRTDLDEITAVVSQLPEYIQRMKGDDCMIPKDPVMLLSFVNLKLRDYYSSLGELCDDLDVSEADMRETLERIDYHYDKEKNQFV